MIRFLCTVLALAFLAACSLGGGGSNGFLDGPDDPVSRPDAFEHTNDEVIRDDQGRPIDEARTVIRVPFDLIEFEALINELDNAEDYRRQDILMSIVGMGREALPHVQRSAARTKSPRVRIDLLYVEESIQTNLGTKRTGPNLTDYLAGNEESSSDGGAGSNATEVVAGEEKRPPASVPDIRDIPEDFENGTYSSDEVDRMVASRLASAQRAFREGNRERTLDLCNAILTLVPNSRYRREVRQLLLDAKTGAQADRHLVGTVRFASVNYRFDKKNDGSLAAKATFTVYLTNVGLEPLEIDFGSDEQGKRSKLTLEVEVQEGNALSPLISTGQIPIDMAAGKITLQPNEHFSFTKELDSLKDLSSGQGAKYVMTRVNVAGNIRPASMHIIESEDRRTRVFRPILFSGGNINVFPSDFPVEQASIDMASFVQSELDSGRVQNLVLASTLVEEKDVRRVVDLLLAADLAIAPLSMREARIGLVKSLVSKDFKLDVEKWQEWWQANRLRYGPPR